MLDPGGGSSSGDADLPDSRMSLEVLFAELDADSSGNISKAELEYAMKKMYGKPLKSSVIDKMILEADADSDGEISLVEFKMLMAACELDQKEKKKNEKSMGMWFTIRERGLTRSREQKASEDMRLRRAKNHSRRINELEKALAEAVLRDPSAFPAPVPLPAGGGLPPRKQVQLPPSPKDRTFDIRETLRRIRSPGMHRRQRSRDLESGVLLDNGPIEDLGCFVRIWNSLPTPGEAALIIFDFFDTYAPLIALMVVPTTALIKTVRGLINDLLAVPGVIAPPPPPAAPDWVKGAQESFFQLAQDEPGLYLTLDLGIAFALGTLAFFWKDISDWVEAQKLKGSYQSLNDDDDAEEERQPMASAQTLRMELYKTINVIEELEIKLRVHQQSRQLEAKLKAQQTRRAELEKVLEAAGGQDDQSADSSAKPSVATAKSEFSIMMNNMSAGLVEVSVYFADIISDVQVLVLLYTTGNVIAAALSLLFLVAQFFVIYIRVLPYLSTTFGDESSIYKIYLWTGFPIGSLGLDVLMFLEPFGLLAVLPLPTWLKTFIPAYKATRVICEVFIESLPQTLLQSYLLVSIMGRVHAGNARPSDLAMLSNVASLPQSITISTLSTLKTWVGLVDEANKAGISIKAKAWQLWNVGGGLPLDALKKGAIDEWTCGYKLDEGEISPLINALEGNSSLIRLKLAESGMEWGQEDSSGAPLITAMATIPTALAGLQALVISQLSLCEIPVDRIRAGGPAALKALQAMEFFTLPGGPWHDEILMMGELLRKDRSATTVSDASRKAGERVVKLLEEVHAKKLNRQSWEERVKQFMVEGHARRAQLLSLVSIEVLRGVGFGARELHEGGLSLAELKAGCFTVVELKAEIGVDVRTLIDLGYSLQQMHEGNVMAEELKPFGYPALDMREGTFTAPELKAAGYTLAEMKDAMYTATELKTAEFTAAQLRKVGYKAVACRKAEYRLADMRAAKYTAVEMRDGGFTAAKVRAAGYDGVEASTAFALDTLKEAGYVARELRDAGHTVKEMSDVGFTLEELYGGGYAVEILKAAGFTLAELKEVGTSLAAMKESGASVKELRAAGYTAGRLKTQDYSVLALMEGGFTEADLVKAGFDSRLVKEVVGGKHTVDALKDAGFSVRELRAGGFSASEFKGTFSVKALNAAGYKVEDLLSAGFDPRLVDAISGPSVAELKQNGFKAEELKLAGFDAEDLREGGFSANVLMASGFLTYELRDAGFPAAVLRDAGSTLVDLKAAYFTVEQLLEANYTYEKLKQVGFTPMEFKDGGVPAPQLRRIGFDVEQLKAGGFSAKDIKGTGQWDMDLVREVRLHFTAKELKNSGLSAKELKAVNFSVKELEAAGFSGKELRNAGFTGSDLRSVNFQAGGLRAVGYTAGELREAGFSVPELRDGGFTATDLKAAHISPIELKQSGFTAKQLRAEGFAAKELTGGFEARELKEIGYKAQELKVGGVGFQELKEIGFDAKALRDEKFTARELRLCGFLAQELIKIGLSLQELLDGGFHPSVVAAVDGRSALALKGEGFDAYTLWVAGFSAKDLRAALFDAPLLHSIGYTAEQMREGGFAVRELIRDSGYSGRELRAAGFTAADFLAAPCSVTELKAAGFTHSECVACGLDKDVVALIYAKRKPMDKTPPVPKPVTPGSVLEELRAKGFSCEQARRGGLLPSQCHHAGYSFEEGREAGFKRKLADWMSMDLTNPYNKWG